MTVMDPRPWSPSSPHIGPDDDDLEMLDPTGDPEVDLGSAVLAVHRVGAAACEAVARAPLPDEFRLIDGLARARAGLAGPAVQAVSKCITSDRPEIYADLLLKDLFDSGENSALAVYRACVSKGVAPPLAAQRAGLVYGVGQEDLGRYISIAADPKAHPVAIADAADRAVTKWASGIVRVEADSEVVSKQEPHRNVQQYNVSPFGQEHPKGRAGRFVATLERADVAPAPTAGQVAGRPVGMLARLRRDAGAGHQAAPEVAEAPAVQAPPATAPAPRPVRATRQVRRTRRVRQPGATTKPTPKIKAKLDSKLSASLSPRVKARLDAQRQQPTGKERLADVHYGNETEISRQFMDRLDTYLAWSMSIPQANEIFRDAKGGGTYQSPKTVQMGQLQRLLAEPIPWGDQHNNQMQTIAEDVGADESPRFIRIDRDELEAQGISLYGDPKETEKAVSEYAHMAGYYDQLAHEQGGTFNPLLKASMSVAPSAEANEDWFLVLNPETVVHSRPEDAPVTGAAEFVVSDPAGNIARVNKEGSPDYPYYELDPTQTWVIKEPVTLWRQTGYETGHWVDRYTVEPLDDWKEEGKAVATEQRWRTEPRNELGEWSRTGGGLLARVRTSPAPAVTPVVTPLSPRPHRKTRSHRKVRVAPVSTTVPMQAKQNVRVEAKLPAKLLHAFHAGLTEDGYEVIDTSVPAWDDRKRYVVYSADDWDHLLRRTGYKGYRNEVLPRIPLPNHVKADFMGRMRDAVSGDDADVEVRLHAENEILERHKDDRQELRNLRFTIPDDDDLASVKWREMGRRIRNLMAVDQTVQSVRIDSGRTPDEYRVMANRQPLSDVVVVVLPDDFDPDRPVTLQFTGRARQSALNRNIDRYYDEALHVDAPVQMFRATQATKKIYHARQDEQ